MDKTEREINILTEQEYKEYHQDEKNFIRKVARVTIVVVGIGCFICGVVVGKTN